MYLVTFQKSFSIYKQFIILINRIQYFQMLHLEFHMSHLQINNVLIIIKMSYRCALHPERPITHFCQSCKDLTCQDCINKQPHSGSMHIIKQLQDSANVRKNLYSDYIQKQVNPVRSEAQKKLSALQMIKKQNERDRKVIEKDIKIEFQAINNRLTDKQSKAILVKQNQIKNMQTYIHKLDDITNSFNYIFENPQAVLISYKTLESQIKKLQSLKYALTNQQQSQKNVDLSANRQYLSILHKSQNLQNYEDRNQFVNKIIQKYIQHYKSKLEQTQKNCEKFGKECNHKYNNIFKKVVSDQTAKACAFCGCPFTIQNLNDQCNNNRTYKLNCTNKNADWQKIIPNDVRGSKRHYWYKSLVNQRLRPRIEDHTLIRQTTKKHYYNALLELQTIKHVLTAHQIQAKSTFAQVVKDNDPSKSGYISKIAFVYVLSKIYNIPIEQIQTLIQLLEDEKGINYANLNALLENTTADYFKFLALQDQKDKTKPFGPASNQRNSLYGGNSSNNIIPSNQSYKSNQTNNPNQTGNQNQGNQNKNYGTGSSSNYGQDQSSNLPNNDKNNGSSYGSGGYGYSGSGSGSAGYGYGGSGSAGIGYSGSGSGIGQSRNFGKGHGNCGYDHK